MSDSVRPHRRQPTRLPHSPGKNTGVGCHFLLQCMKVESEREVVQSCATLCDPMKCSRQASLSITNYQSSLKLTSIESVMPSNHFILCFPLLLLPSIFPSIRDFSNPSALCIRWPNICSFSFKMSPSNEHPGLISFRTDWLDLLAVQGTLKNLLQHHSSKASILLCQPFLWSNSHIHT